MSQSNNLATPQEISLSLCMIVKNEAYFLDECLRSARPYVDQIVVLETGSTDASREIARRHADVVERFDWVDDFSAARNASLALASGEWIPVLESMLAPVNSAERRTRILADIEAVKNMPAET